MRLKVLLLFIAIVLFNSCELDENGNEKVTIDTDNLGVVMVDNSSDSWEIEEFYYLLDVNDNWSQNLIEDQAINFGGSKSFNIPLGKYSVRIVDNWGYEFELLNIEVKKDEILVVEYDGFNLGYRYIHSL